MSCPTVLNWWRCFGSTYQKLLSGRYVQATTAGAAFLEGRKEVHCTDGVLRRRENQRKCTLRQEHGQTEPRGTRAAPVCALSSFVCLSLLCHLCYGSVPACRRLVKPARRVHGEEDFPPSSSSTCYCRYACTPSASGVGCKPVGEQAGEARVLLSSSLTTDCRWTSSLSYGQSPASLSTCSCLQISSAQQKSLSSSTVPAGCC